jgi:leader peptidase (prepilin peptidase)/N-methyltransferase
MNAWHMILLGLLVGSFANVMIHRLPRMVLNEEAQDTYNLSRPASHCPHCQTPLRWFHNIPVLSFLLLRGQCAHCQQHIAWRYPLIELSTACVWWLCAWHWASPQAALCWALLGTGLLTLAIIDWDTTLLPDALTQPLLWLGLLASLMGWTETPLNQSVTGAMLGYLSLWTVATVFKQLTHKEGMGGGDFKLLATIGAWLGPWLLWPVVLVASVLGVVVGLWLRHRQGLREGGYLPFGPFLAMAAATVAWFAPTLLSWLWLA